MNVFWPEGLQKLADSGEITFKDGERLNLNLVRKMDNGLYLINLKGKSFTAQLNFEPQSNTIRAEVTKSDSGTLQLRFIPKAENSANPLQVTTQTTSSGQQKLVFQLPAGTIDVKLGDKVPVQLLKTLENGNTLVAIKNNLFEVKLDPQVLKSIITEVAKIDLTNDVVELIADKLPVQNLNPNYIKQEVGTFDIEKLMKVFGKFQSLDVANLTPESLKQAIKNSGLFLEHKLLNNESVSDDEKLRAYINSDAPARDGITKMQITNLLLAGGLLSFLKTQDENIDDTYVRLKKGNKGQNTLYVSTKFSQLGDTFLIIRSLNNTHDIMIKTEVDISEQIKELQIENARIHWFKYSKKDLETMDVKGDISFNLGKFEVII